MRGDDRPGARARRRRRAFPAHSRAPVRAARRPRTAAGTAELAEQLGLHPNGVRLHLERMERDGLVVARERTSAARAPARCLDHCARRPPGRKVSTRLCRSRSLARPSRGIGSRGLPRDRERRPRDRTRAARAGSRGRGCACRRLSRLAAFNRGCGPGRVRISPSPCATARTRTRPRRTSRSFAPCTEGSPGDYSMSWRRRPSSPASSRVTPASRAAWSSSPGSRLLGPRSDPRQ